ncbi:cyclic nucleotide-gated channel alpha-3-like [Watersipora subatra]|uniref:cyclic nucleotide-gated channel alpha-3-like n=1 Tax=Watersipora subatra TaxID=2589382 RepID=UPI00355BA121
MWKFALYSSVNTSRRHQVPQHNKRRFSVIEEGKLLDAVRDTEAKGKSEKLLKDSCGSHDRYKAGETSGHDDPFFLTTLDNGNQFSNEHKCSFFHNAILRRNSRGQYTWLCIISTVVLYNYVMIAARTVFAQLQANHSYLWILLDCSADAIYIVDMIMKGRTSFLSANGLLIEDWRSLWQHYLQSTEIKLDVLSILPTDFLYFLSPQSYPICRLNRLLRWRRVREFFDRSIQMSSHSTLFRVLNLLLYILIIIHWNGCIYYAISTAVDHHGSRWAYSDLKYENLTADELSSLGPEYIYSFYWSTLTLLTIGETHHPETDIEYLFTVFNFLLGVLVFATIVGNIGSMISHANNDRANFFLRVDNVKRYMRIRDVNQSIQKKILSWLDYIWSHQQMIDEGMLCDLPDQLRAKIALDVHIQTLSQVGIFQHSEPGFLTELVLRLKLQVFSPGDFVCRSGDIGREMFIVKSGVLQVASAEGIELATLHAGSVFGEISVLEIPAATDGKDGKKRVADVISVGYSDCFSLSKADLWDLLKDYPETRQGMIERGKQLLVSNSQVLSTPTRTSAKSEVNQTDNAHMPLHPCRDVFKPTVSSENNKVTVYPETSKSISSSSLQYSATDEDVCSGRDNSKEVDWSFLETKITSQFTAIEAAAEHFDKICSEFEHDKRTMLRRMSKLEKKLLLG